MKNNTEPVSGIIFNVDMSIPPERVVMDCPYCKGLGEITEEDYEIPCAETCPDCEGTGLIRVRDFAEKRDLSLELAHEILLLDHKMRFKNR